MDSGAGIAIEESKGMWGCEQQPPFLGIPIGGDHPGDPGAREF